MYCLSKPYYKLIPNSHNNRKEYIDNLLFYDDAKQFFKEYDDHSLELIRDHNIKHCMLVDCWEHIDFCNIAIDDNEAAFCILRGYELKLYDINVYRTLYFIVENSHNFLFDNDNE